MRQRPDAGGNRQDAQATGSSAPRRRPDQSVMLGLQRTAGNRALARAATSAPAKPRGADAWDAQIAADVEWIAGKLSEQVLTQREEYEILDRLQKYDDADFKRGLAGDGFDSALLDRMLLALKLKVFSRRTIGGLWHAQHSSAFDLLWHELEGDRQEQFKRLLRRSRSFGREGAGNSPENFWLTMGRQQAMGLLGIMKGLSAGAAGIVDAGAGGITTIVNAVANPTGEKGRDVMAQPIKPGEWVGKQYDVLGEELFGRDWKDDKVLLGRSAGQIGEFGGKVVWGLVMVGAGGQLKAASGGMTATGGAGAAVIPQGAAAAARAELVLEALGKISSVAGVVDPAIALVKDIERLQKADKLGEALHDQQFGEHLIGLLAALYGAIAKDPEGGKKWADHALPIIVEAAQLGPQLVRLGEIYHSTKLSDAERAAAYGDAVEKIIERIVAAATGLAKDRDEKRAASKIEAQAKMREGLSAIAADKRARDQAKRYKAAEKKALQSRGRPR